MDETAAAASASYYIAERMEAEAEEHKAGELEEEEVAPLAEEEEEVASVPLED